MKVFRGYFVLLFLLCIAVVAVVVVVVVVVAVVGGVFGVVVIGERFGLWCCMEFWGV